MNPIAPTFHTAIPTTLSTLATPAASGSTEPRDSLVVGAAADGAAADGAAVSWQEASRALFTSQRPEVDDLHAHVRATLLQQGRRSEVTGASRKALYDAKTGTCFVGKTGPSDVDAKFEKKYLTALDGQGNEKWTFTKASMTSDPALDTQGRVCFRSRDRLYVVDSEGHEAWSVQTSDASQWEEPFNTREPESLQHDNAFNVPPRVGSDGTVYVLTSDDALGFRGTRLMAARDGREQWSRPVSTTGARYEVAGADVIVREHVVVPEPEPSSFFGKLFSPKKDPSYVDRVTRLDSSGQVRYSTAVGNPVTPSWSDDNDAAPFTAGPDGSAYVAVAPGALAAVAPDGQASWTFEIEPGGLAPNHRAWIPDNPVTDAEGNIYLTVNLYTGTKSDADGVHAIKLSPDGTKQYDTVVNKGFPKHVAPVLTPRGELVVVTEEKQGGIAAEERERLTVIGPDGSVAQDLVQSSEGTGGWNTSNGLIRSVSPGNDGEVLVEMEPWYCTSPGDRSYVAVPSKRPPAPMAGNPDVPEQRDSTIRVEEEWVVIGGVQVRKRQ